MSKFICILFFSVACYLANAENTYLYNYKKEKIAGGQRLEYSVINSKDCRLLLKANISNNYSSLYLHSPRGCKSENLDEILSMFASVTQYYEIFKKSYRKNNYFYINILDHRNLYPLVNKDKNWPKNIRSTYTYQAYVEKLKEALVHPDVYGRFVEYFKEVDCNLSLLQDFADPIYDIKSHHINKKEAIERNLLANDEARKDIYPSFKGWIMFDLRCR